MRKALSRSIVSLTLATLLLGASSCIGSFKLTSGIADWNRNASEEKWVNEILFLALVIIPVYEIGILVDAIILNSIEFWGGKNPVESSSNGNVGSEVDESMTDSTVFPVVNG